MSKTTEILNVLTANGIEPEHLDDLVHDAASSAASTINNHGKDVQVEFLLANCWTPEDIYERLSIKGTEQKPCRKCSHTRADHKGDGTCSPDGYACMCAGYEEEPVTKTYNHMLDVAFEVISPEEDWGEIPIEEILTALEKRVAFLRAHQADAANAFGSCDSFEVEE